MDVVRFALLGVGAGSVYALMALGLVLVYRGSGVLNFAQGAMGMIGAFTFYVWRDDGMPSILAFALSVALGVAIGVATHFLIMRPLRRAPAISRLIATLALLTVLLALGLELWGDTPRIVSHILPIDTVTVLPNLEIGVDRLILFGVALTLTAALTYFYRHTRFGLATSAVAENRRVPSMLGISPDFVAAANWGLGSGLAVVAAILIVNVSGLNVTNLALLVVPGMAAALVGSFRSFWLTLAGGLLIGVLESEVAFLQTKVSDPAALQGWGRAVPFLVIIVVLMVRGRALPLRSEAAERPPEVGTGRVRPAIALPLAAAGIAIIAVRVADERGRGGHDDRDDRDRGALARRRHRIRRAALARAVRARRHRRVDRRPTRRQLRLPVRARRGHRDRRHRARRAARRPSHAAIPRSEPRRRDPGPLARRRKPDPQQPSTHWRHHRNADRLGLVLRVRLRHRDAS